MSKVGETVDARLSRLGAETAGVTPRRDFAEQVMRMVEAPRSDWSRGILRWATLGVAVASMAAALCVTLAWTSANNADHEEASNYGLNEVFE